MSQKNSSSREIAFNYTSSSDRQAVEFLLGGGAVEVLDELRERRVTGRSARLLNRIIGEILVHRRNPYLFEELVAGRNRRRRFFASAESDLALIEGGIGAEHRVLEVTAACRRVLGEFRQQVEQAPALRRRLKSELGAVIGAPNVLFDPFSLVAHATDATDWRLHLPLAVVTPDEERQVAPLLAAIGRLGLKAIPRGAGTGLTGGAVPLRQNCIVINTEKLNRIRSIHQREMRLKDGHTELASVMEVEAGVITEQAMNEASRHGLVFATDPTSAWASTIGGNISENAGGKKAVRWGTCIDNLLEWRMAMPGGTNWTIRRVNHPMRKILPGDEVDFEVLDEAGEKLTLISLLGSEIRKPGLWKDITNKALGGLPGLQKEGTDGVITSAVFILYPEYEARRTLCLEFFGPDMEEASRVIVELSKAFPFPDSGHEALLALEHFDEEYIRAIGYKVKAARAETPKAALLIDIAGHTEAEARRGVEQIRKVLEPHPNTMMFVARDAAEAERFWADRKKLGAIARRTNAFKLNEDIVIPLSSLAVFARFIDQTNLEQERLSQADFAHAAAECFAEHSAEEEDELREKLPACHELCRRFAESLQTAAVWPLRSLTLAQEFRRELEELAHGWPELIEALNQAWEQTRARRIVLATHMHAGDGNVHVNVPVLSNDRQMLEQAEAVIDRVMARVVELGGVVSGEHGIGVTKLKYLEPERIAELSAYRRKVDPQGIMNPGKLEDLSVLSEIFTPSFNLLELEARILQHGQLEELSHKIAHCVRCGKCKADCCVFYPARGIFYHPRNKNLAIGSLIEALLYDAQRERSTQFELLRWLEEVADHCTICHKCLKPCPVDIDTGAVSVLERNILATRGYKHSPLVTRMSLSYLESRSKGYNSIFRAAVLRAGGAAQRLASPLTAPLQPSQGTSSFYPLRMLKSSVPPVPAQTLRDWLPECGPDQVLVFEPGAKKPPVKDGEKPRSVFYFPGCGSERMFSEVSAAALHLLSRAGVRVVLPPPFLCCGFPAQVNAKGEMHSQAVLRDTILFSQIREMLSYMEFDACVVSCGTCREALLAMKAGELFGGRIVDVARYVTERGLRMPHGDNLLYHAPCHDSMEGRAKDVLRVSGMGEAIAVPHCCSEAGTLALSRPDISDAMLDRKREAIREAMAELQKQQLAKPPEQDFAAPMRRTSAPAPATLLTNCPSCLQGLGRNRSLGAEAKHMAVAFAEALSGRDWRRQFEAEAKKATTVTF